MTYRGSTTTTAAAAAAAAVAASLVRDRTSTLRRCNILLIDFCLIIDIRSLIVARVVTETFPPIPKYHVDDFTLVLKEGLLGSIDLL